MQMRYVPIEQIKQRGVLKMDLNADFYSLNTADDESKDDS